MRLLVLVLSLAACKASIGQGMDGGSLDDAPGDSSTPDLAMPLGPWGPPAPVDITPAGDDDPTATADLLELYFNRSSDIYVTKRASLAAPWDPPVAVAELNTTANETTPEVSGDGLTMYLASARTGTAGGNDIWISTRATRADPWGTPVRIAELSSAAAEGATAVTADALTVVMDTDRAMPGNLDIYTSQRATSSQLWDAPAPIAALNTAEDEGNPMLSTDRLTIYFDSNRTGDGELYVATRSAPTAAFGAPQPIAELNSAASSETDPWVSPDGRTMYFTSNRDGTQRLWQTTR